MKMQKLRISCIYLDLDGVIFDFENKYYQMFGVKIDSPEAKNKYSENFKYFIENQGFTNLELLPDAHIGLEFLRKCSVPTQILSSTGWKENQEKVSKQKMICLQKYGITFNPIFVPGKQLKQQYAAPDRIIIDDTESVVTEWREKKGIAILHKNWEDTLVMLRQYV